jgi:hypothetical protein
MSTKEKVYCNDVQISQYSMYIYIYNYIICIYNYMQIYTECTAILNSTQTARSDLHRQVPGYHGHRSAAMRSSGNAKLRFDLP